MRSLLIAVTGGAMQGRSSASANGVSRFAPSWWGGRGGMGSADELAGDLAAFDDAGAVVG